MNIRLIVTLEGFSLTNKTPARGTIIKQRRVMFFKDIDVMIQDHVHYNPESGENDTKYQQLKSEIETHFAGELAYDQLSPDAQQVLADWEDCMAELCARGSNYEEQPEHF